MQYFSTHRRSELAGFAEALLAGQPADKGLFFPERVPKIDDALLADVTSGGSLGNDEIAFRVMRPYVAGEIPDETLFEICRETIDFPFPLVSITERISTLELFHGPTMAFKDVGARFMSRCLRYFSRGRDRKTVVIVATSGDTGGAVAAGFHGVEAIEVVILFPKGRVSKVQEMQLTRLGGNVTALEVEGSFDDCQALAKRALADADLSAVANVTSANSINIARWLPQQIYYFLGRKQWHGLDPVVAVPSGNFGNLAAGLLAKVSGLPIRGFVAACNANDVVPEFFLTGHYRPRDSVATLSNAMDVGDPSNFVRILEMFGGDTAFLKDNVTAVSISDERTVRTIRTVYEEHGYVLDPHAAVGFAALIDHLRAASDMSGFILGTAHPVKFDSVEKILQTTIEHPQSLQQLAERKSTAVSIDVRYDDLKQVVLEKAKS